MSSGTRKKTSGFDLTSGCVIRWEISDTLPVLYKKKSLASPHFVVHDASWYLGLDVHFKNSDEPTGISLKLTRIKSFVPIHILNCHVTLEGSVTISKPSVTARFREQKEESRTLHDLKLMEIRKLRRFAIKCLLSGEGVDKSSFDASALTEIFFQDMKDIGTLCQHLKNLLLNGQDHDVILNVKGKQLCAHRNILRSRSQVLQSMLSHDMVEKSTGVIHIPDCEPDAFEQFLHYLYSGKVEKLDAGNMMALYYIADKYDVGYLKEKCREFIKLSLSSTCISHAIQLALDHSDADLLQCATDYFVENVSTILRTLEWQSFVQRNGILANELFMKAAKNWSAGNA